MRVFQTIAMRVCSVDYITALNKYLSNIYFYLFFCSSNSAYLLTLTCRHTHTQSFVQNCGTQICGLCEYSVCVDSIAIQCICKHQQPCHTDPLLLSTMLRCVATEIEIMIMCPSDCIKVLPLQKKPGGMKCK